MTILNNATCEVHGMTLQAPDVSAFLAVHKKCGKATAAVKPDAAKKPTARKAKPSGK